jgi:hypothetical protein
MRGARVRWLFNSGLKLSGGRGINYNFNPNSSWNVGVSSLSGIWAHLTDASARDEFQIFVKNNVINQTVLTQDMYGRVMMMALFHGLRNPLLRKHNFDVKEFVENVAPALEVYHETLLQLRAETSNIAASETDKGKILKDLFKAEISNITTSETDNEKKLKEPVKDSKIFSVDGYDNSNGWRKEATDDPTSLAAMLSKIMTNENFDEQYRSAQLDRLLYANGIKATMSVVAGSCAVEYVTLLNANVTEIDDDLYKHQEHPEFAASDENSDSLPVVARIQVLYNLTRKFRPSSPSPASLTSAAESYKSIYSSDATPTSPSSNDSSETTKESTSSVSSTEDSNISSSDDDSIYLDTRKGVAMLVGWLHGGPDNALRWKVAMAKEAPA